jgi:hypothetical protein
MGACDALMLRSGSLLLEPHFPSMPKELQAIPRWVVWKDEKVPYCAAAINAKASATDPETWTSFDQAQLAYEEGGYLGVGFVLNGDGIVGVDLDKCVDGGNPAPAAMNLLDSVGCQYIEFSPSGRGLRGFGYGEDIAGRRGQLDGINVELYASKRYLTVTGRTLRKGRLAPLRGFAELARRISQGQYLQKRTEDDRGHLLLSSVGTSSSVGIPAHTLPTQEGERNQRLFELARYLKGQRPDATRNELRAFVMAWHESALPVIATKDFTVTFTDFMRGWDRVKHPYGQTMQTITQSIDHSRPLPAAIQGLGYGAHAQHLVRLCMALQEHQRDEPFFLSARQAGEQLGVHFTDASKMLAALVADGVLTLVSKGAGAKASRYRIAITTF